LCWNRTIHCHCYATLYTAKNTECYTSPYDGVLLNMQSRDIGLQMHNLIVELYPICRSITGDGFRQSLDILGRRLPLEIHEVPSGTVVFDWIVPKEWNIRDAYIKNPAGAKIVDFQDSNLHVLNYSVPIHRKVSLGELKAHLFSIPEHPDWIPYRTSYYQENWGFCVTHRLLECLEGGEYEVHIDSSLKAGYLTYGEYYLPGQSDDEILISCHSCHPSLCNDNLSGMALATFLAKTLGQMPRRYAYRFLFIPGTIGSITWLALNEAKVVHIKHGLVVACVGDRGSLTYKKSRQGDAEIDRAAVHVLKHSGQAHEIVEFSPYGYDERQYCSPGFNLAVGSLTRTPHGRYPEYHTSADNLDLVQPEYLADSLAKYLAVLQVLEHNCTYRNTNPRCEPQLGRRGLYSAFGGRKETKASEMAMLWLLNLSDGSHSLLDIAERSGMQFHIISAVAMVLQEHGLLEPV
jgi:aminopeptidase-like protein